MIALVLEVIDFFIEVIEIFRSSPTSTNTGVAPVSNTELAVAANVMSGIITSEPLPIPSAFNDRCNAAVPLDTPTANFAPVNFANIDSNLCSFGPSVSNLEFNAFKIEFLSLFVISGIINGTFIEASPNASLILFFIYTTSLSIIRYFFHICLVFVEPSSLNYILCEQIRSLPYQVAHIFFYHLKDQ